MSLKQIVRKELTSCSPTTSIQEVARMMKQKDVGSVLVVENGRPAGIVTDRDLVLRCLAENLECETTAVSEVMTTGIESVSEEDGIYNVVERMKKSGVRRIPVVDRSGRAVALLSFDDVFELIAEEMDGLKEVIRPRHTKLEGRAA